MNRLVKMKSSVLFGLNNSKKCNQFIRTFLTSRPLAAGFTKDFKPGPYPKTEAERIAAAKKYGMRYLKLINIAVF
jgi:hypothetical protein